VTTAAFWLLLALYGSTWTPLFVPLVHLVPHARDLGVPALWAASLISFLGIAAVAGRLLMGALSDRAGRRPALALALALQALAFLGFWATGAGLPGLAAASVAFGFSYGAVSTLFPAVVGDFFGRAHAGTLVGLLFTLAAPLAAVGPLAAGWVYDHARSYDAVWWASASLNLLALALLGWARPPVHGPRAPSRAV
jgi:MFS family permease